MENFEYYNPVRVLFGEGILSSAGQYAKELGQKAIIVTYEDAAFLTESLNTLHTSLRENGISYVDCFAATVNPKLSEARVGIDLCKESNADFVIGIGGGSAMDCAKIIAAGVLYQHDLASMISFSHSNNAQIPPVKALPMMLIPTLPATGSEMNPTAVITDEKTVKKSYVWAPSCLYAKITLIDPNLTCSLPAFQTACGAIDTIAHIAESYFNGTAANLAIQDHMQEGVIRAVIDNLPIVLADPNDKEARGVMMWAASIALNGWLLAGTYTWAPMHQMSHVIGARFNASHGAILGTMILAWMTFFAKRDDNARYSQFAERIFGCGLDEAANRFSALLRSVALPVSIADFGVTEESLDMLTEDVKAVSFNAEGVLASVPALTEDEIRAIYQIAYNQH